MTSILHISDLHFGRPYLPEIGEDLLRTVSELSLDAIVVSGDFTQRAKPAEFAAARRFLEQLPRVPRVVVPGNHDVALYRVVERFRRPFDHYREHIGSEEDACLRLDGATIVALNSTSPRRAISNGRIHLDQLEFLDRELRDEAGTTFKIVVAHHHFLPAPDFERDQVMPQARRALDRLVNMRVDLILGGHLHRAYVGHSLDVYAGADREHGIVIGQCGTSTSRRGRGREREKNSFNLIHVGQDSFDLTHYLHFHELGGFAPSSRHTFPRAPRRTLAEVR